MSDSVPPQVSALLDSANDAEYAHLWEEFLAEYSELLLKVSRAMGGGEDAIMDRYAFIVDELARDRGRRLRGYVADGRAKFRTWLAIVAQRLVVDEHRHRYGRPQGQSREALQQHQQRKALVDLVGDELELAMVPDSDQQAEFAVRAKELHEALQAAIAQLPAQDRLILRFRFEDGLSVPQIARITGAASPFHVYRRLDTLLTDLRHRLAKAGVDGPSP